MLKRSYHGTLHHFSAKHMQRYIDEFATRQGLRESDTPDLMGAVVGSMIGKRLTGDVPFGVELRERRLRVEGFYYAT